MSDQPGSEPPTGAEPPGAGSASAGTPGAGTPDAGGPPPGWGQAPAQGGYGPPPPGYGSPPPGYGPPPPGYGAPAGYGAPGFPARATEGTAIAALVCGIAAFVVCPLLPAIAAVILGPSAKRKIRESGGRLEGEGLATAGQVIGWINIGFCLLVILIVVILAAGASSNGY